MNDVNRPMLSKGVICVVPIFDFAADLQGGFF